jgi:hypothetical protein
MEVPAVSIKIKGMDAINALAGKGQLLGGMKLKGAAALGQLEGARLGAAKGLTVSGLELETEKVILGKHGFAIAEIEAKGPILLKSGAAKSAGVAKGATLACKGAAAKGSAGTIWTAKGLSLGLGVGLGAVGPFLVLAALGLGATGIYLYRRNKKLDAQDILDEEAELESP